MPGYCSSLIFGIWACIIFVFRYNFTCRYAIKCFHLNINKSNLKICFQILFESFRLPLFLMLWLSFLNITHHFCLCFTVYTFFPSFPPLSSPVFTYLSVSSSLFPIVMTPPSLLSLLSSFVFSVTFVSLSLTYMPSTLRSTHIPHLLNLPPPCSPILWMWRKVLR